VHRLRLGEYFTCSSCRSALSFRFAFESFLLLALAAEFPDDALGAELAVTARVCAGLAKIKAFLAISDFHFVAFRGCIPIRMVTAFHEEVPFSEFSLAEKVLTRYGESYQKKPRNSTNT
jgi:hypothetical protein